VNARAEGGYTLIELLTVMTILAVVLGGVTTLFVSGSNAEADSNRRFQAQTQARVALDKMRRQLHNACSVSPASPTTSATFTMPNTGANPPACDGAVRVTWCVRGSANRWALYQVSGASCTGGTKWADYLLNPTTPNTAPQIFSDARAPSSVTHTLASIGVSLPVNVLPSRSKDLYRLEGNIVFRNSGRL
jgi:prepilin-type N-terminal cleavage/methylation domain-containing protein